MVHFLNMVRIGALGCAWVQNETYIYKSIGVINISILYMFIKVSGL